MSRIIVYGPQGSGLSSFARDLAEHYGKRLVVDGWAPGVTMPGTGFIFQSFRPSGFAHE